MPASSADDATRRSRGTLALVTVLLVGAWLVHDGERSTAPPQPGPGPSAAAADGTAAGGTIGTGTTGAGTARAAPPLPRSTPVRVRIPAVSVDAPLVRLSLDAAGVLQPPPADRPAEAGWFAGGVTPGERGTAVLAGHVDTRSGPAVFYGLGALRGGQSVRVDRADGGAAVFTVDAVRVLAQDAFHSREVYGAADRPELRLITCGGDYSARTGYTGNVVVFAHLTGAAPAAGHESLAERGTPRTPGG
jgi:hypothetical protein